nr:transposase family protein [Streptomyces sp. NBC_00857]
MSRHELTAMTAQLAAAQAAQRERQRHTRRGTERRRAPGAGPRPKLTEADRVMATVLYLRKLCTQAVLGELFAVDRGTITTAVQETRPLLEQHGYAITPSTARFPAPADLIAFLARTTEAPTEIKPAG